MKRKTKAEKKGEESKKQRWLIQNARVNARRQQASTPAALIEKQRSARTTKRLSNGPAHYSYILLFSPLCSQYVSMQ